MVTTTTKLAKGAIEVGKTTATTTGSIEIVNTDTNGKTQVVIKDSESNTTASNNNSTATAITTSTTTTPSHITSKTIELKRHDGVATLKLQENTIKTSLKFKLNNQHIVEIKAYRDITFPDIIAIDGNKNIQFVLYELNGSRPKKNRRFLLET